MIINDLDGYYIVFDTKNWNTELDTLFKNTWFTEVSHVGSTRPARAKTLEFQVIKKAFTLSFRQL